MQPPLKIKQNLIKDSRKQESGYATYCQKFSWLVLLKASQYILQKTSWLALQNYLNIKAFKPTEGCNCKRVSYLSISWEDNWAYFLALVSKFERGNTLATYTIPDFDVSILRTGCIQTSLWIPFHLKTGQILIIYKNFLFIVITYYSLN